MRERGLEGWVEKERKKVVFVSGISVLTVHKLAMYNSCFVNLPYAYTGLTFYLSERFRYMILKAMHLLEFASLLLSIP